MLSRGSEEKYIYIDNFRGFADTILPLVRVNFLVGENSTGKSSILKLINAISAFDFVYSGVLSDDEETFDAFDDIVSESGKNKKEFTIGYASAHKYENNGGYFRIIITYKNSSGKPTLYRVSICQENQVFTAKVTGSFIYYKDFSFEPTGSAYQDFESLVRRHNSVKSGFIRIEIKKYMERFSSDQLSIPLVLIFNLVANDIAEKMNKQTSQKNYLPLHGSEFVRDLVWLAPIRTQPRRTYDGAEKNYSPDGKHTPYKLKKYLRKTKDTQNFIKKLSRFGRDSNLFEKINIKPYGKSSTDPFEITVTINGVDVRINNVGYGVSQSLPIIVEILTANAGSTICIQQPEVHLHPKAQAALGEVLASSAHEGLSFMIETHSDFTIDRYRMSLRSKKVYEHKSQIIFFSRDKGGNSVVTIDIDAKGNISDKQPALYRDFFIKEELGNLGMLE